MQDLLFRRVKNNVWIIALMSTLLSMVMAVHGIEHLAAVLLAAVMGFLFWRVGIWGGSDGRWLPLCLAWLPLKSWPVWLFIFCIGWGVYSLLAVVFIVLRHRKWTQSDRGLALLPIMLVAQLCVSALIKLKVII